LASISSEIADLIKKINYCVNTSECNKNPTLATKNEDFEFYNFHFGQKFMILTQNPANPDIKRDELNLVTSIEEKIKIWQGYLKDWLRKITVFTQFLEMMKEYSLICLSCESRNPVFLSTV
jgi:transposase